MKWNSSLTANTLSHHVLTCTHIFSAFKLNLTGHYFLWHSPIYTIYVVELHFWRVFLLVKRWHFTYWPTKTNFHFDIGLILAIFFSSLSWLKAKKCECEFHAFPVWRSYQTNAFHTCNDSKKFKLGWPQKKSKEKQTNSRNFAQNTHAPIHLRVSQKIYSYFIAILMAWILYLAGFTQFKYANFRHSIRTTNFLYAKLIRILFFCPVFLLTFEKFLLVIVVIERAKIYW